MTPAQFELIQSYLIRAFSPFIEFWVMIFLAAVIVLGLLMFFMVVTRELLARAS